jgi:hypothetical protein
MVGVSLDCQRRAKSLNVCRWEVYGEAAVRIRNSWPVEEVVNDRGGHVACWL